jgi:hypothetical protein
MNYLLLKVLHLKKKTKVIVVSYRQDQVCVESQIRAQRLEAYIAMFRFRHNNTKKEPLLKTSNGTKDLCPSKHRICLYKVMSRTFAVC